MNSLAWDIGYLDGLTGFYINIYPEGSELFTEYEDGQEHGAEALAELNPAEEN